MARLSPNAATAAVFLCIVVWCGCRPEHPQSAFDRALTFLEHGTLSRAQEEAERGIRAHADGDPFWSWQFRLLEADILNRRGLSEKVLEILAPEIPESLSKTDLPIRRGIQLGIAYSRTGDIANAEKRLDWVEKECASASLPLLAEAARARGVVEVDKEEFAAAEASFRKSLLLARQQGDRFLEATDLLNLGVAAILQEHFDESADWSRQSQLISREIGAKLTEEKALGNLGWAYYKLGDYERSLPLFQEAASQARDLGGILDEVIWNWTSGFVYYQTGRLEEAEQSYRQSLKLAQQIQNRPKMIDAITAVSLVLVHKGDYDQAAAMSDRAIAMARADERRSAELYPLLVRGMISARKGESSRAERTFQNIATDPHADISLRWEAQENLARLYEDNRRPADADRLYREALATFQSARASLLHEDSKLPFLVNASRIYDDYLRFLVNQGRSTEALRLAEESRARTLTEGLRLSGQENSAKPATFSPQAIARASQAVILFYWLGEKESFLWAITPSRVQQFLLPPGADITALSRTYRKSLVGPRDPAASANAAGVALYNVLIGPAQKLIPPNGRVFVIADGELNSLNFETLLVSDPRLHYWIEDATIINANSLRLLAAGQRRRGPGAPNLLLLGNAVSPGTEYPPLAKAAVEISDVGKHFAPAERQIYEGALATPTAYLESHPEQYSFIHFVAHGTASRLSPLESAVVLSKATADEDSFKLYARKIIQHPISAELVTISTCYGAGSRAYAGEGLVGLSWAFLRAGAHHVIGALWEVSDTATPQLMDSFYGHLRKGMRPDDALRLAKLEMLHSQGVFRKPFYWAPFQLYTGS